MKMPAGLGLGFGVILISVLVGACSSSVAASRSPEVPRVALMHVGTDHLPPSLATLVARLAEMGWLDGTQDQLVQSLTEQGRIRSPKLELLWKNLQPDQAQAQAAAYVRDRVSVIVAFEDKSIAAAQAATSGPNDRIPVVFLHPSDPVRQGLVDSLSHPGGNLTGVFGARDPVTKQLELYKEIVPALKRLLTLVDPTDTATPPVLDEARAAAVQLGIELDIQDASDAAGLDHAFQALQPGDVDGAFILSPSLRLNFSKQIIGLATAAQLPVQAHRKEWVEQGALFSLGVDVGPVGAAGARYVDAILRGTAPADLPVEEVPQIQFAISLKTAAALHIDIPAAVLERADVVYR
jgi:putative tryptophan/tyrosine transport system substrate-binding protein